MTPDEIIELLQGVKAGRKWGIRFRSSGDLVEQASQEAESLCRCIVANDVERVELLPLPDEITIPARVIPAPLLVAENGQIVYKADPSQWTQDDGFPYVESVKAYREWLAKGLLHATSGNAIAASKAMCPYA